MGRRRFALKLAAGLLFAVMAYGGAYLLCVRTPTANDPGTGIEGTIQNGEIMIWVTPVYPFAEGLSFEWQVATLMFFDPANAIDCVIRRDLWKQPRTLYGPREPNREVHP